MTIEVVCATPAGSAVYNLDSGELMGGLDANGDETH
jgi:hypothetical protein